MKSIVNDPIALRKTIRLINSIANDHIIALKKTIHHINKKMLLFNTEKKIQVISTFIKSCIIFGKPINYDVTYNLCRKLSTIVMENPNAAQIIYDAVNIYFPNNELHLFQEFLKNNKIQDKYYNNIDGTNHFAIIASILEPISFVNAFSWKNSIEGYEFWFDINKKWTNILYDYQTKKIESYNETNYGSMLSKQFKQFLNQHGQN